MRPPSQEGQAVEKSAESERTEYLRTDRECGMNDVTVRMDWRASCEGAIREIQELSVNVRGRDVEIDFGGFSEIGF